MGLPQVDVTTCVVFATAILGAWVRLKLPIGWPHHEASLRRQNRRAYWSFGALISLEIVAANFHDPWSRWLIGLTSGVIFYFFALATQHGGQGFWSKRRNQAISIAPLLLIFSGGAFLIEELSFLPLFTAFAVSQICHKRYIQMVYSSIQDLETLQAKILKQEATHANLRHFSQWHEKGSPSAASASFSRSHARLDTKSSAP